MTLTHVSLWFNTITIVIKDALLNKTDTVDTVGLNTFVITSKLCPNYDIITFYLNIFI